MSLHVVIGGASGFLGRHLSEHLRTGGHRVTRLVRGAAEEPDASRWDPYAGQVDRDLIASADVVVNLAGSPTAGNPHSQKWARELRESRVVTTRVLAGAVAAAPAPPAYLAGNGIAFYGDHGGELVTEATASTGEAFMTSVTRDWQDATAEAVDAGARVCVLRTSPVLDRTSAPLKQMLLAFRAGLGATLGDGRQHFPCLSLRDWVAAVAFLAEHDTVSGPVNLCCPETPTNAEFTRALGDAVHRPTLLRVPSFVLRPAAGRLAPEVLGSVNARPQALLEAGYEFADPDITAVIAAALG